MLNGRPDRKPIERKSNRSSTPWRSCRSRSTAARFGVLKQQLASRGRTKADVDLHIAATAIDAGATLITNDGALLAGDIEELVAENWI